MSFLGRLAQGIRYAFRGEKALTSLLPSWEADQATYPAASFGTNVTQYYHKNEWIFACISTIAQTASQLELKFYDKKSGKELPEHPLAMLMREPNPHMSGSEFWSAVHTYQQLSARAYFEIVTNRAGIPVELWPLRPDWMQVIPSKATMIAGYKYGPPGTTPVSLNPEQVLSFPIFDPMDWYKGFPPANIAARVGSVDNSSTDFLRLFIERGGSPSVYIKTVNRNVSKDEKDAWAASWSERYGGWRNWTRPAVLDGDADVKKIGSSVEEMGFEVLDQRSEVRICGVFHVPPIIVGAKVGLQFGTYSNYETAERAWWRNSLKAKYRKLNDDVQNQIVKRYGFADQVVCRWDYSQVESLQDDIAKRWTRGIDALGRGGITLNMFYSEVGLPLIGPSGDVFLRPMTVIEVPLRHKPGTGGGTIAPSDEEPDEEPEDEPDSDVEGEGKGEKSVQPIRSETEVTFTDAMREFFAEQKKRIETELAR